MQERLFDELCPYIREAGLQHQDSWRNAVRRIYDHQFLYCFIGQAHAIIQNRYYKLLSGAMIIVPPNTPHRFWVDDVLPGELYWMHCDFFFYTDRKWLFELYNDPERYMTLFGTSLQYPEHIRETPVFEGGYRLPEFLMMENDDTVEYLFRSIHKAYQRHDRFWQLAAKSDFLELLNEIFCQTVGENAVALRSHQVAGQMKRFVAGNYYHNITVKDICATTGLNCEYASKLFNKETGLRPVEYLNRYRVGKAKRLMLESDLSIADIAEMVGFNSVSYFCSVIKKYEGCSPEILRAKVTELLADEGVQK